jgi:hypothetical protein
MKQTEGALGASYEALRGSVPQQPVVHTDDTGWRTGGKAAFLMAFVTPWLSVYQIRPQHRNEEVRELIPADFRGILVCDRGRSYDAAELENVAQQKCLAHLIRNAATVAKAKTGRSKVFSQRLRDLFDRALSLRASRAELRPAEYCQEVEQLEAKLTAHLKDRTLRDEDNQKLLSWRGWNRPTNNPSRAGPASGRYRAQSVALLEEREGSQSLRVLHQHPAHNSQEHSVRNRRDAGETARPSACKMARLIGCIGGCNGQRLQACIPCSNSYIRCGKTSLAVEAAILQDWSNGPVEGQVNRLKTLKCQMYGRELLFCEHASFPSHGNKNEDEP